MSIQFPNLGINLDYVGKSIQIFGFEITFFGLVIALGMLLGMGFVILEAKRCGENKDDYLEMMIISLLLGVVGSRMLYVLCSWNLYKGNIIEIFNVRNGGLTFYGGLFGGMLGAAIYCGVRRKSFMQMADTASMGIVIAQIIGRWGDFFNRESFGEYTNSIFAMQLPLSAVRSSEVTSAMRENLETIGGTSYIQVHPVFLYESLWCLLLFLLMLVWKRKKHFHGEVFLKYLAGYGLGRFCIELLRTDKLMIPGTSVGISQLISAALFVICAMIAVVEETMAKRGRQGADAGENRTMKRRKEQPEKLKQKNTETGSDWRELLQMEMPQVFRKSITEQHLLMNMIPKNQKKLRLWKKSIRKKILRMKRTQRKSWKRKIQLLRISMRRTQRKIQKKFLRRKLCQKLPVQKIMWKKMPGFLKKKLLLRRVRQLQKKMNGCIASRADLRKNLPMSRKIDHMIVRYLNLD